MLSTIGCYRWDTFLLQSKLQYFLSLHFVSLVLKSETKQKCKMHYDLSLKAKYSDIDRKGIERKKVQRNNFLVSVSNAFHCKTLILWQQKNKKELFKLKWQSSFLSRHLKSLWKYTINKAFIETIYKLNRLG